MNDQGKFVKIKSVLDIDWSRPLWEQLAPVLKGGPNPTKSQEELRALRAYLSSRQCHHCSAEKSWCP